jgi:hypothetical protein
LYFLLGGAALFVLADQVGSDGGVRRIVVTDAERSRLSDQWQAQMSRPPSEAELEALTEQWIREEIYYREARAMGLDHNDVIIRRRLTQKLTFLTEDLATAEAADQDTLRNYYLGEAARYTEPARWSFIHHYFSTERRQHAEADAHAALVALDAGGSPADEPPVGDPFMLQQSYVERSQLEIGELFGREFAAALAELPEGTWQGPLRSAYGWHLVRVDQQQPGRQLEFEEVSRRVAADFRQHQRRQANEAFYQSLLDRYEIVRP